MVKQFFKYIVAAFIVVVILLSGYIVINLILYRGIVVPFCKTNDEEIVKEAVTTRDLRGKDYIICKWARVTGYNYTLVKDENGKRAKKYIIVSGVDVESKLSYEFLTAGNSFVFYVVEKKEYYSEELGEHCIEYIVDSWDVLYPVKHESVVTTIPKYILISDCY